MAGCWLRNNCSTAIHDAMPINSTNNRMRIQSLRVCENLRVFLCGMSSNAADTEGLSVNKLHCCMAWVLWFIHFLLQLVGKDERRSEFELSISSNEACFEVFVAGFSRRGQTLANGWCAGLLDGVRSLTISFVRWQTSNDDGVAAIFSNLFVSVGLDERA